jgi:hypothetical protein
MSLTVIERQSRGSSVLAEGPKQGGGGIDSTREKNDIFFHTGRSQGDDKRRGFFLQGALLVAVFVPYYGTQINEKIPERTDVGWIKKVKKKGIMPCRIRPLSFFPF